MHADHAIDVEQLSHDYATRRALDQVSFHVAAGEIFGVLGPNGSGKTTLFRVLSTLMPPQSGSVALLGHAVDQHLAAVRAAIGVVFQAGSLDRKLTVQENLFHQAALYGLSVPTYRQRRDLLLRQMGLHDRRDDRVETLSGGLRRRLELAKGMIHAPRLLLMDEPTTGLDPGARSDVWRYLRQLRDEFGVTIVLTTHLLDEAEKADRIAIVHLGRLVALDRPASLRAQLGGDVITLESEAPTELAEAIRQRFQITARVVDQSVRLEEPDGHVWVPRLVEAFPGRMSALRLGQPTLEDVFIHHTGHRFWQEAEPGEVGR